MLIMALLCIYLEIENQIKNPTHKNKRFLLFTFFKVPRQAKWSPLTTMAILTNERNALKNS